MGLFDRLTRKNIAEVNKDYTTSPLSLSVFGSSNSSFKANDIIGYRTDRELLGYYRSWVKASIDQIAMRIGKIDFQITDKNGKVIENHPALDLINHPQSGVSGDELIRRISSNLDLVGRSPIYVPKIAGIPTALIPLPPIDFYANVTEKGEVESYTLRATGKEITYDPRNIVFFKTFNPMNVYDGMSTTRSALYAIEALFELENWELQNAKNGMSPTFGIEFPETQKLRAEQIEEMKTKLMQSIGGSNNAGTPLVLSGGGKYIKTGLSMADLSLPEIKNHLRDTILGQYGVPKSVLGITEDVNRANAEAGLTTFYENVIDPRMRAITETLQEFFIMPNYKDVVLTYKNPIPSDKLNEAEIHAVELAGSAWMTPNEVRELYGMKKLKDGDNLTNQTLKPLPPTSEPGAKESKEYITKYITLEKSIGKEPKTRKQKMKLMEDSTKRVESYGNELLQAYAKDLRIRVLSNLSKNKSYNPTKAFDSIFGSDKEAKEIDAVVVALYEYAKNQFTKEAILEIQLSGLQQLVQTGIGNTLTEIKDNSVNQITKTLKDQFESTLTHDILGGLSIEEIKKNLMQIVDDFEGRIPTISATEATKIANVTHLDVYKKAGVQKIEWVTMHDERVRIAHKEADGQVIDIGDKFLVGGEELEYPGDPSGSPENIINCRCRILAIKI